MCQLRSKRLIAAPRHPPTRIRREDFPELIMTRFPLATLLLIFIAVPALSQSASSPFDNFDTRNGVQVYVEPATPLPSPRSRRGKKSDLSNKTAANHSIVTPLNVPPATVEPTLMSYAPL